MNASAFGFRLIFCRAPFACVPCRLANPTVLKEVGFWLRESVSRPVGDDLVRHDSELADVMGTLCISYLSARVTRSLSWLRGWPHRALRILEPDHRESTVKALMQDYEHFLVAERFAEQGDEDATKLAHRSIFKLAPVRQLVLALRASDLKVSAPLLKFLDKKSRRIVASQLCEDGFNKSKNSATIKGKKRYMVPGKAMHAVQREEVACRESKQSLWFVCCCYVW